MSSRSHRQNSTDGISKVLNANRKQVIKFAKTNKYKHTNDITVIPLDTQFYEVNTNNNMISFPKKRKSDTILKTVSTAPYFIITDDPLESDSIVDWSLSNRSLKGGKRTRIRKSTQKRRTTKRR